MVDESNPKIVGFVNKIKELLNSKADENHKHGNITNAGAIGTAANKPVITTTSGKLTTGSFEGTASNIKMNGTQNAGSSNNFARADHVHPTDTSRASTAAVTQSSNGLAISTDKQKIDKSMIIGFANTGGTTSAFTASISGVTLTHGTIIALYNAVGANTASATLNVNSLGAKPIYYNAAVIPASRYPNKATCLFMYNTSIVSTGCWQLIYSYDSNTTYSLTSLKDSNAHDNIGTAASTSQADINTAIDDTIGTLATQEEVDDIIAGYVKTSDSRLSDARTPKSHTHGNISNEGVISNAASKNVVTDANGKITTENKPTIPSANTTATNIKMDGTQNAGSLATFAKADHVHPTDTSRASTATASASANGLMSKEDKAKMDKSMVVGQANVGGTTSAYTATITGVTLTHGTIIALYNAVGANAASATLNVNSLGAKPIYYNSSAIPASRYPNKSVCLFMYNTSIVSTGCWQLIYSYDSNNTYTAASATPTADTASGAVGTSAKYAREDHVHPQSSIYAEASHAHGSITSDGKVGTAANKPLITGTSGAVSAGSFEATATNIKMNGTQAVGSLNTFARGDHVHPTDSKVTTLTDRYNGKFISGVSTVNKPFLRLFNITSAQGNSSSSHLIFEIIGNNNDRLYAKIRVDLRQTDSSSSNFRVTPLEVYGFNLNQLYFCLYKNGLNTSLDIFRKVGTYVNFYIRIYDDHLRDGTYTMYKPVVNGTESYTTLEDASTSLYNASYATTQQGHDYDNVDNSLPKTNLIANSFKKNGGTSSEFLKADGSTDNTGTLLTSDEKTKLGGIATGATKNVVSDSLTDTSTTNALSAKQGKVLNEAINSHTHKTLAKSGVISAGDSLNDAKYCVEGIYTCSQTACETVTDKPDFGGNFYFNLVVQSYDSARFIQTIYLVTVNTGDIYFRAKTGSGWSAWRKIYTDINIPSASTSQKGIVQLTDSISSTSTTTAATPKSVKTTYDLANGKADDVHTHTKSQITDFPTSMTPTSHSHGNVTNDGKVGTAANKPLITGTNGVVQAGSFGTAANTFCQGNDSRLSDARTPKSHTHTKSEISDFPTTMTPTSHTHGNITNDGKVGTTANKPLITGTNGVVQAGSFGTAANTFCQGNDSRLSDARTPTAHTHTKSEITDFPTSMTPTSHTHGNITNVGAIGTTANKPIITTTSGKLTTGSFGKEANTFAEGNHEHAFGVLTSGNIDDIIDDNVYGIKKDYINNGSITGTLPPTTKTGGNRSFLLESRKYDNNSSIQFAYTLTTTEDYNRIFYRARTSGDWDTWREIIDIRTLENITEEVSTKFDTAGTGLEQDGTQVSIKSGGVTATQLASNAVTSAKIADKTIVAGDIADTTITGGKLANATVTATQLASNAVETAKIKDSAVTSAKIANNTIVDADISSNANITFSKLNITKNNITNLGIASDDIATSTSNGLMSQSDKTFLDVLDKQFSINAKIGKFDGLNNNLLYPTSDNNGVLTINSGDYISFRLYSSDIMNLSNYDTYLSNCDVLFIINGLIYQRRFQGLALPQWRDATMQINLSSGQYRCVAIFNPITRELPTISLSFTLNIN